MSAIPEPAPKIPRVSKKKPEYTGSRWAGLALLILTLLISFLLYLKGQLNSGSLNLNFKFPSLFGPSVYTWEK